MTAPLQYLLTTVVVVPLEKVSFSDTQNPKTVCIDSRKQAENIDIDIDSRKH